MYGIQIRTNARHAKQIEALLSPTRSFVPTGRGVFVMESVSVERDVDFIVSNHLLSTDRVTILEG